MLHSSALLFAFALFGDYLAALTLVDCEDGLIPFGNHCYHFLTTTKTWYEAKNYCNMKKGYLAAVETSDENEWLKLQIRASVRGGVWIGGVDFGHEGVWKWESNGAEVAFKDFRPGDPDNHNSAEHCLEMGGSGSDSHYKWNDGSCLSKLYGVCEKERQTCVLGSRRAGNGKPLAVFNNY